MLQKSQKQQKIVFKTSLLWAFTSKKVEICASNDVNHFFLGNIRKVSFFEVGSKLKFFSSITCLTRLSHSRLAEAYLSIQTQTKKAIFDVQNDECDLSTFFLCDCLRVGSCVSESMPHQSIGILACLAS